MQIKEIKPSTYYIYLKTKIVNKQEFIYLTARGQGRMCFRNYYNVLKSKAKTRTKGQTTQILINLTKQVLKICVTLNHQKYNHSGNILN